jgi:subtilase family serine protease
MKFATSLAMLSTTVSGSPVVVEEPALCCGWSEATSFAMTLEEERVKVMFAVEEQNLDALETFALEVSDPENAKYGKYWTQKEIDDFTAPRSKDTEAVAKWLAASGISQEDVQVVKDRLFVVNAPRGDVERLLQTKFRKVISTHGQSKLRGRDYSLPEEIDSAVASVFGVHGLPLPPRPSRVMAAPGQPAAVTPSVIESTYKVSGVKVDRSGKNRQAVAEFQGQTMNSSDLKAFFAAEVPSAEKGDDEVAKFVGDPGDKSGQTEASLDIQFIMGVAPGVKTEFWLYDPSDFCADLKNWTTTMLADDDVPLVHSVSYGWQGNLTQIGCKGDNVDVVDADFKKLAAKGITIVFASGDSGSGYAPSSSQCEPNNLKENTAIEGTVKETTQAFEAEECCEISRAEAGFTFTPAASTLQSRAQCSSTSGTDGVMLEGTVLQKVNVPQLEVCCLFSSDQGIGWSFEEKSKTMGECTIFSVVTGNSTKSGVTSGRNAKRKEGKCEVYSSVTGTKAKTGATSGGSGLGPKSKVVLWPSWPASSPWVTAVGATRFVGQTVGNEEMASDQFGSGGGFSKQFGQSPDATWQSADVAEYLKNAPQLPPADSFPAKGRATPDVSALGEGFQVYLHGRPNAVGGTSASAPTFAGLVSLLNEARLQDGKAAMGFLNPFLYKNADAFFDVTKGTNAIGRGTGPIKYGFNCTKGWDPATGIGTPMFDKLLKASKN